MIGIFRTGIPQGQDGLLLFTAEVFEVQPDKYLVSYPVGLNYRRPEWVTKDKLVDWVDGCGPVAPQAGG